MTSHAPRPRVIDVACHERPFGLRLPFRFGVMTLTAASQAVVQVTIALPDGRSAQGFSAEVLLPKWFDKSPQLTHEDNVAQLRRSLEIGIEAYRAFGHATPFGLATGCMADVRSRCRVEGMPALVAAYGPALLDRAVLDAVCRLSGCGAADAMRANLPGLTAHPAAPDVATQEILGFLAELRPRSSVHVRHTVGMHDPLDDGDLAGIAAPDDGLPVTLAQVIARHGVDHFKIKLSGDASRDAERLKRIAAVIDPVCPRYRVTLDGNEQFDGVDAIVELWRRLEGDPALSRLCEATLFVEQPLPRDRALTQPVHALASRVPAIIDESDDGLDAFPRARSLGYQGVSSKSCKGLYKSLLNAVRCRKWLRESRQPVAFMSAEDLIVQAGLSLQQDLALVAILGVDHVERNGHHYVTRMATCSKAEAAELAGIHPSLYGPRAAPALRIEDGCVSVASCTGVRGFASGFVPDTSNDRPMPPSGWTARASERLCQNPRSPDPRPS